MGKFKQIDIDIEDFIKRVIYMIAILSTVLVLILSTDNTKLKEQIELIEEDRAEMMKEIVESQK